MKKSGYQNLFIDIILAMINGLWWFIKYIITIWSAYLALVAFLMLLALPIRLLAFEHYILSPISAILIWGTVAKWTHINEIIDDFRNERKRKNEKQKIDFKLFTPKDDYYYYDPWRDNR